MTAALFGLAGAVLLAFTATPSWVVVVLDVAVAIAAVVGITVIAKPEV